MRLLLVLCLVSPFVSANMVSTALGAQNVANTNQKGSLLVFPRIDIRNSMDTVIQINNDYEAVKLKCFWYMRLQQAAEFELEIPRSGLVWFSARTGVGTIASQFPVNIPPFPGTVGELVCFATDGMGSQQISFNHLSGTARIYQFLLGTALEYGSWNFTARVPYGCPVGPPGLLPLTGDSNGYDACPQYLVSQVPVYGSTQETFGQIRNLGVQATLSLCSKDLRSDYNQVYTRANFTLWDENGNKFGIAYKCLNTWFEGYLHQLGPRPDPLSKLPVGGYGGALFTVATLHSPVARIRIDGVRSTGCESPYYLKRPITQANYNKIGIGPIGSSQAVPLLGLFISNEQIIAPKGTCSKTATLTVPATAGYNPGSCIRYDPTSDVIPEFVAKGLAN